MVMPVPRAMWPYFVKFEQQLLIESKQDTSIGAPSSHESATARFRYYHQHETNDDEVKNTESEEEHSDPEIVTLDMGKKRKVLHQKTANGSHHSFQQSLHHLSADTIVPKLPKLQLPLRVYAKHGENKFEAIVYDIDEPSGSKTLIVANRKKKPRNRMFIRVVKVPGPSFQYLENTLYSNLSSATGKCQAGSTESGWTSWSVKTEKGLIAIGNFRAIEKSNGSGFIRSPTAHVVYRDVLARESLQTSEKILMMHTTEDLIALGYKDIADIPLETAYDKIMNGRIV